MMRLKWRFVATLFSKDTMEKNGPTNGTNWHLSEQEAVLMY